MAATNISGAERLPEADYSVAHRSPPPVPLGHHGSTSPRLQSPSSPPPHAPGLQREKSRGRAQQQQDDSVSVSTSEHKRRGSFGVGSFLRRTASGKHIKDTSPGAGGKETEDVPPLPTTRIAQVAHAHQAAAGEEGRTSTSSRKASGEGRSMLRKSSSKAKREQERQAREAERQAHMNRPPPQLNPLPEFGPTDGENRPDSVAIFNNQYHSATPNNYTNSTSPPVPRANNFSRPGAMPASSSPAYAVRGGSAYSGSSPNMTGGGGKVNGSKEYVVDPTERTESMTNRGRMSYASSMAPVNVSSPRRVRRRKDPTPFK